MVRRTRLTATVCAAVLAGCQAQDGAPPSATDADASVLPDLTAADAPLDREALLLAVLRAASAAAIGDNEVDLQRNLEGKRFELRLRVACPGEEASEAGTRDWIVDENRRVVRLTIGPEIEGDTPLVEKIAGAEFEAVEGFWIRRPWLLQAACPALPDQPKSQENPAATTADRPSIVGPPEPGSLEDVIPRVGIAQFFTASDARTHRRNRRAYQATENLSEGEAPGAEGYDLIVQGRLRGLPDGRIIACRRNGAQQPSCIISARFDQVALERADTGELLAEWPQG